MENRTNVMRILDRAGVRYRPHHYDASDGCIDGEAVAAKLGQPADRVYKTLVTAGGSGERYVFVVPVGRSLDLKAAARAVGEKAVELIPAADLQRATGYIRGGCSPIGMKKALRTVVDASCPGLESVIVSAGRIGFQVELSPADLLRLTGADTASVCR